MITMLAVSMLSAASAQGATETAIAYQNCVQQFAIGQIRSGESAETLVRVGETNCASHLSRMRQEVRAEIEDLIQSDTKARELPWEDVQALIDEGVEDRISSVKSIAREATLRNVIFVMARIREMERQDR